MDRFDDIWNNRFNSEQLPIEDWSTPDSMVWEGISSEIEEKKAKRSWWFLWLFGVLLLSGTVWFGQTASKSSLGIEDRESKNLVGEIKNISTQEVPQNSHRQDALVQSADASKDNQREIVENSVELNSEIPNDDQAKSSLVKTISKTANVFKRNIKNTLPLKQEILSSSISAISTKEKNLKVIDTKAWNADVVKLEMLSLQELMLERSNTSLPMVNQDLKKIQANPRKKSFSIGANFGLVYFKHKVNDKLKSDLSPFEFIFSDEYGWMAGLDLIWKPLKKISFFTSFEFENIKTTSGHNSQLVYDLNAEQENANRYSLDLASPFGFSEATFLLVRNTNLGASNVDLQVDFVSEHNIINASIPVGVKYNLIQIKKFDFSLQTAFGFNRLLSLTNSIKNIDTHHSAITYQDQGATQYMDPVLNKWHFDYRYGCELNFLLNKHLKINLSYAQVNGLSTIFELDEYNTKVNRVQLQLGVKYINF